MFAPRALVCGTWLGAFGLNHEREAVEKLSHARGQRSRQLGERAGDVLLEGRRGEALDEGSTEIQRAQLRKRKARVVEPLERALLEHPVPLAVDDLVVEREARGLQRFQIPPDGARRDTGLFREVVNPCAA